MQPQGFSLMSVIGIVLVVLKLCAVIDWSWWWVLLPFYGPLIIFLVVLGFVVWARSGR